jgi:hypothetical protein
MCKSFRYGGPVFEAVRDSEGKEKVNSLKDSIMATDIQM